MEFRISKKKLDENNAIGVNIMFGDNRVRYISNMWEKTEGGKEVISTDGRGKAIEIINNFLSDLQLHSDIETYIMDRGLIEEIERFMGESGIKESIIGQIDGISAGGDYFEIDGKEVVEKALENMRVKRERYGAYIIFETMVVREDKKEK